MSLDSRDEAKYRAELADGHLERARKALSRADFADTVSEAQLSIEKRLDVTQRITVLEAEVRELRSKLG